jgi:hypothetical protein
VFQRAAPAGMRESAKVISFASSTDWYHWPCATEFRAWAISCQSLAKSANLSRFSTASTDSPVRSLKTALSRWLPSPAVHEGHGDWAVADPVLERGPHHLLHHELGGGGDHEHLDSRSRSIADVLAACGLDVKAYGRLGHVGRGLRSTEPSGRPLCTSPDAGVHRRPAPIAEHAVQTRGRPFS